ncbi:sensor histidine kinase [Streptomyces polyrhachis]|uniref:histidine kinase n=1 Tax=Streptomyces polyrhachis TaxID=1282885 RepID=A0ABW2GFM7_9ACTN
MQRVYDFLRRHPTLVDSFWALCLGLMSSMFFVALTIHPQQSGGEHIPRGDLQIGVAAAIALGYCATVALRRRWPSAMVVTVTVLGLLQLAFDTWWSPANFAMLIVIFTAAARDVTWASRWALIGGALAPTIAELRWPERGQSLAGMIASVVFMTVAFLMAWVLGDSMRTRRAYYAQLEERAHRLEREREAQSRIAVAAERARIARELHDVVAHNVSVMVVQADGAAYVLDTAPDQAKAALTTISATGRQALTEMRRLLGVLRTDERGKGAPGSAAYVPQPGVEQLTELVEQVRGAGLTVDFTVEGTPCELPSSVELTAYRIVQEALTNTRKHGGPQAGATVRLTYGEDGVQLLVEDDGRGAGRELYEEGGEDGQGHGLIGMRERVGMVGGVLDAGPRPGGGFRVTALLPLPWAA